MKTAYERLMTDALTTYVVDNCVDIESYAVPKVGEVLSLLDEDTLIRDCVLVIHSSNDRCADPYCCIDYPSIDAIEVVDITRWNFTINVTIGHGSPDRYDCQMRYNLSVKGIGGKPYPEKGVFVGYRYER